MKCIQCESLCLRLVAPETMPTRSEAKAGWGKCEADSVVGQPMMVYFHRERECSKFKEALADVVEARIKWSKEP